MSAQSNIHFYLNWAKERLDEMEATLTFLEAKADGVQVEVRGMANKVLADLRTKQREFRDTVKKNAEANEAAWIAAKAKLEADWKTSRRTLRNMSRALASTSSNSRRPSRFRPPLN
jgi:hypothetical protein